MGSPRNADRLARLLVRIQKDDDAPGESLDAFREAYRAADAETRLFFFTLILSRLEVAKQAVEPALRAVFEAGSPEPTTWTSLLTDLRRAIESPRMRAFRKFLSASGGLKFLLDLRADVLTAERQGNVDLGPLHEEIAHLFTSWFQSGFLFLQEITEESPYRQIRFLKEHDMVHPAASLEEMGSRLGSDRRCFALYHRAMAEEPVVFIEVALTRRIPRSIHEVLDEDEGRPAEEADTAIFYSINNTQNGLGGLGLGKTLIFQVVDTIKRQHPEVRTFATLSPVSGFRPRYLDPILEGRDESFSLDREGLERFFTEALRHRLLARFREDNDDGPEEFFEVLREILADPLWIHNPVYAKELARPLSDITFFYLTREKDARGKPLNPVANFHMGNGARLSAKNVHFGANRSERGLLDSAGMMVSYVYSSTWLHELRRSARAVLPSEV